MLPWGRHRHTQYACEYASHPAQWRDHRLHVVSYPALDAEWFHIPHRPTGARVPPMPEASIPLGDVDQWLWSSGEARRLPAYCQGGGREILSASNQTAFLEANQSAVQQPGAGAYAHGREPTIAQSTRSEILVHRQP